MKSKSPNFPSVGTWSVVYEGMTMDIIIGYCERKPPLSSYFYLENITGGKELDMWNWEDFENPLFLHDDLY